MQVATGLLPAFCQLFRQFECCFLREVSAESVLEEMGASQYWLFQSVGRLPISWLIYVLTCSGGGKGERKQMHREWKFIHSGNQSK